VQALELILIAAAAIGLTAVAVARRHEAGSGGSGWSRLLVGVVPGLVGVLLVTVPMADLIPDDDEGAIWLIAAVVLSAIIVIGTAVRLVRG
jgi:hypothetical protein